MHNNKVATLKEFKIYLDDEGGKNIARHRENIDDLLSSAKDLLGKRKLLYKVYKKLQRAELKKDPSKNSDALTKIIAGNIENALFEKKPPKHVEYTQGEFDADFTRISKMAAAIDFVTGEMSSFSDSVETVKQDEKKKKEKTAKKGEEKDEEPEINEIAIMLRSTDKKGEKLCAISEAARELIKMANECQRSRSWGSRTFGKGDKTKAFAELIEQLGDPSLTDAGLAQGFENLVLIANSANDKVHVENGVITIDETPSVSQTRSGIKLNTLMCESKAFPLVCTLAAQQAQNICRNRVAGAFELNNLKDASPKKSRQHRR